MKIEIKEDEVDEEVTAFSLFINGQKVIGNTGLVNVCEYLMGNYSKLIKKFEKKSKKGERND